MTRDTAIATKEIFLSREQVLVDLSQRYGDKIASAIGANNLKQIPGNSYSNVSLFNSSSPDEEKDGLRSISFFDKGDADSFWVLFDKKHGCALGFTFERENRAVSVRNMMVMQYDFQRGKLAIKDVVVTKGIGIEEDKTYSVPVKELNTMVEFLINLLPIRKA